MKVLVAAFLFVLLAVIHDSSALCCGRGKHGYCNDCKKVGLFKKQKCCHAGGYNKNRCNIFCCNCKMCAKGNPYIKFKSGWWLRKTYTCAILYNAHGNENTEVSTNITGENAMNVFSSYDADGDNVLSPQEFADAASSHLDLDQDGALGFSAQLLKSDNQEIVTKFTEDAHKHDSDEIYSLLAHEFMAMDTNMDGNIQACEFDKDLA